MYINGDQVNIGTSSFATGIKLYLYDVASGPIIALSGLDGNYRGLTIKNTNDAEQWFIGNNASNNFVIRATGSNDILTVNASTSNVGIGTTTSDAKLDVNGSLAVRGSVSFTGPLYTGTGSRLLMVDSSGNVSATSTLSGISMPSGTLGQTLRYGASGWEATSIIYIKNDGNVGIGTTTPDAKLHIVSKAGANYHALQIDNQSGEYPGFRYYTTSRRKGDYTPNNVLFEDARSDTDGTVGSFFTIYRSSALSKGNILQVGNTTAANSLVVSNTGYVGIGTASPSASLTVNGNAIANPPTDSGHLATKGYVDSAIQKLWINSSNYLYASSTSWDVGIGTTTPGAKLDVNGSLAVRGAVSFTGPSYLGSNRLLMVDANGNVSATTTLAGISMPAGTTGQTMRYGASAWEATSAIYVKNDGNVGIGTQEPVAKLQIDPFWFSNPDETDTINLAESDFANVSVAPQAMITMNNRDRSPGAAIGLALHNADRHPGAYAPLLVFSKSEISGQGKGFNSAIAAIGAQTVEGTGGHGMWVDGDLMFYTAPKNGGGLVERMRITQGGNVGINTQNPLAKLDVNGSLAVRGAVAFTNSLYTGTSSRLLMVDASGNVSATTTLAGISMPAGTTGQTMRYGTSAWEATSAIYVKNDGNVGIGDIGPTNKLSVIGNIAGSGTLNISSSGLSYILGNLTMGETGGFTNITLSRYLNISGNDYAGAVLRTTDVSSIMISAQNGTPAGANFGYAGKQMVVGTINDSPINFIASGTSKMLMTSSGKVGIGTTAPATTLHIYPNASTEGLRIVSSDYSPLVVRNSTDLVDLFRVNQSGDVTAVTSSATRMRSDNYCDADGNNCFDPSSVGSSIGYFATVTSGTYTGNNNNNSGYDYAHGRCNAQLAGSHVCTAEEILNTIRDNKTLPSVNVWIFNGPPGYTAAANDCEARSTNSESDKYGAYWEAPTTDRPKGRGLLVHCDASLNLACCD